MSHVILSIVGVKTMANHWLSGQVLSRDIAAEVRTGTSRRTVNRIRRLIHFHNTTPRKHPKLPPASIVKRIALREKVLAIPNAMD
jgi:hypothetical protein